MITIAKRGEVGIQEVGSEQGVGLPWGQYSAVDFVDDIAWFAGSVALEEAPNGYGSIITTEEL